MTTRDSSVVFDKVVVTHSTTTGSGPSSNILVDTTSMSTSPSKPVRSAVYAYIKAIRALGRQSINTSDIAAALGITETEARRAVRELHGKGLRFVR
jgi:hypothetical protein